ncbi:hypothetical protein PROFUN_09573 [Planoprotostelium fungivorum]|uniref:Uncharacterized protein n=1 Tax=Planoprotostelium fungivorum TaxID=1890364 RepID=A0A2P6NGR2_9EUKA|nr:hypothetical protein PROFUN_09573 [Planoprotostelium fungivorum]
MWLLANLSVRDTHKEHLTTTKSIVGNTYGGLYSTDAVYIAYLA